MYKVYVQSDPASQVAIMNVATRPEVMVILNNNQDVWMILVEDADAHMPLRIMGRKVYIDLREHQPGHYGLGGHPKRDLAGTIDPPRRFGI